MMGRKWRDIYIQDVMKFPTKLLKFEIVLTNLVILKRNNYYNIIAHPQIINKQINYFHSYLILNQVLDLRKFCLVA